MADRHHWDYFLAIEEDVFNLSRFIHFSEDNLDTYSIELARLLMASTQEIDVLFKQICTKHGDNSEKEPGYRNFFSNGNFLKIRAIEVAVQRTNLKVAPFKDWISSTPTWWTANNKVKHERHTHFKSASLENVLNSVAGLLIANIYFANEAGTLEKETVHTKLLIPVGLVKASVTLMAKQFKVP